MKAHQVIEVLGGRAAVRRMTGLSKGRLSQWEKDDAIPRPWMVAFHAMRPDDIPESAIDALDIKIKRLAPAKAEESSHA